LENNGRIKIVGSSVSFIDLPLYTTNHKLYTVTDPEYLPLDPTQPFQIKVDGVEIDPLDTYTIDYNRGEIMFDQAEDRTGITCDGSHLLTATFGMLEGITFDTKVATVDVTFMGDKQERFLTGKKSTTVTIDTFYAWDNSLEGYFNSDQLFQIEVESGGVVKTLLGFFDQNTISVNNADTVKRNLKFIGRE
jgi:hypothetical protein